MYRLTIFVICIFSFISVASQARAARCSIDHFQKRQLDENVDLGYMRNISTKVLDRNINQSVSGMIHSKESDLTARQKKARQSLYIVLEEYALLKGAELPRGTKLEDAYLYPDLSVGARSLAGSGEGNLGYNITKYGANASGVEQAIRNVAFDYICPKLDKAEVEQLISNVKGRL